MRLRQEARKFGLTLHVVSSVGWLGAVASFLVLALFGLSSPDIERMRAAYVAMELTGWWVIVPLSVASLISGIAQSVGTEWGLFRHYWVTVKLLITPVATLILLVHLQPTGVLAAAAVKGALASSDLVGMRTQLILDAGAALVTLLFVTGLSVYKPRGLTPYGWRTRFEQQSIS